MHIPDGYLSPVTDAVMFAAAAPFWAVALRKVRGTLKARTVPVLALFSAFSFVVMMFNIPLPGGTTAHIVDGTLLAVVLGPWPAVLGLSVVLGIQALFFGDGGLLSLGANCFNMAIVMPLVGYFIYKLISSRSAPNSPRRVLGAAAGAYVGINAAALFTSVELGLQPLLFHAADGTPLYAPYNLATSLPAVMAGHLFIAGVAEALMTGLVMLYLQRAHSTLLETGEISESSSKRWILWLGLALLALAAPIGLLASGTAWGEWGVQQLKNLGLGYIPQGIQRFAGWWPAPLPGYGFGRLGAVTGYVLSAFIGMGLVVFLLWIAGRALVRRGPQATPAPAKRSRAKRSQGFISRNIAGLSRALESVIAAEDVSKTPGLLQKLDPRAKLASFALFIVAAGLAKQLWMLAAIFLIVFAMVAFSKIPLGFFIRRVLLFIPVFTAVIAVPALFVTPGDVLWQIGAHVAITRQGLMSASFLFSRVSVSLSLGMLLILATRWNDLLAALRWFKLPALVVAVAGMTYRYLFLLVRTANSTFMARRSRTVAPESGGDTRRWLGQMTAATLAKSQRMSEEVYAAMLSRGYSGEALTLGGLSAGVRDYVMFGGAALITTILLWVNYR